jgi:CMP-N-acetylneuraminic acid synthetase
MKVLGVIPARGGSKTVPHKNICLVAGKPLVAYTIECAARSTALTRCIVSTDSREIAEVCRKAGGDVPFLRPAELAGDDTPTLPVLLHALEQLHEAYDAVMILQPTSPLRTPGDIDSAVKLLDSDPSADSVVSVVKVGDHHPARMKQIRDGVLIDPPFAESVEGQRRQDLSELYLRNGAIYLTRTQVLKQQGSLKGRKSLAYVMPEERSVNVDGQVDLILAEALILRAGGKK